MSFRLMNALATFQALMNEVFKPLLRKCVLVFFDDILVYSKSLEEHTQHLEKVLDILQSHQLYVNRMKCSIAQQKLEYLSHISSEEGVATDQTKIEAMLRWPTPKTLRELRGFLGLTRYYKKFVACYSKIVWPLTEQLKKNNFGWNDVAEEAFQKLKLVMVTVPVLALPDFAPPFVVETDASGHGLGAVLMQGQRPLAYRPELGTSRYMNGSSWQ